MSILRACRRWCRCQSCIAVVLYALLIVTCANWFTSTLTAMNTHDNGSPKVPPHTRTDKHMDEMMATASHKSEEYEYSKEATMKNAQILPKREVEMPEIAQKATSFQRRSLSEVHSRDQELKRSRFDRNEVRDRLHENNIARPVNVNQSPDTYMKQLNNNIDNNNNNNNDNNNVQYQNDQNSAQNGEHFITTTRPKPRGPFISPDRIVHFDLKGAPPKATYLIYLFGLIKQAGATGVLLEWEDMFPYEGRLINATSLVAYTPEEIHNILQAAKNLQLKIIPLVQTFAHLEWIFKLAEFAHLRDNKQYSNVACAAKEEAWTLIQDMIDQVAETHNKYGMNYYHIGCDEVFQVGSCPEASASMRTQGGKEGYMVWHIARTAAYIKKKYNHTNVLIWHDMIAHMPEQRTRQLHGLVEPVVWNYAEDIERYMSPAVWDMLKPFNAVWGASAYKGADGPMRYHSNPNHYIRNHHSWLRQIQNHHMKFRDFRGIILTGWSRYDHFAVLCEILPVAIPSLLMSLITLNEGSQNAAYPARTRELVGCPLNPSSQQARQCNFTGFVVYQQIQQLRQFKDQIKTDIYSDTDPGFEFNGWLGRMNNAQAFSSNWYLQKLIPKVQGYFQRLTQIFKTLDKEMSQLFEEDTVAEFLYEYVGPDLEHLGAVLSKANKIRTKTSFLRRPLPGIHPQLEHLRQIVN